MTTRATTSEPKKPSADALQEPRATKSQKTNATSDVAGDGGVTSDGFGTSNPASGGRAHGGACGKRPARECPQAETATGASKKRKAAPGPAADDAIGMQSPAGSTSAGGSKEPLPPAAQAVQDKMLKQVCAGRAPRARTLPCATALTHPAPRIACAVQTEAINRLAQQRAKALEKATELKQTSVSLGPPANTSSFAQDHVERCADKSNIRVNIGAQMPTKLTFDVRRQVVFGVYVVVHQEGVPGAEAMFNEGKHVNKNGEQRSFLYNEAPSIEYVPVADEDEQYRVRVRAIVFEPRSRLMAGHILEGIKTAPLGFAPIVGTLPTVDEVDLNIPIARRHSLMAFYDVDGEAFGIFGDDLKFYIKAIEALAVQAGASVLQIVRTPIETQMHFGGDIVLACKVTTAIRAELGVAITGM